MKTTQFKSPPFGELRILSNLVVQILFAKSILAVKGISAISLEGILGEAGDLSGFVLGNALQRMLVSISQKQAQANGPDR